MRVSRPGAPGFLKPKNLRVSGLSYVILLKEILSRQIRRLRNENWPRYVARELVAEVAEVKRLVRKRPPTTLIVFYLSLLLHPALRSLRKGLSWPARTSYSFLPPVKRFSDPLRSTGNCRGPPPLGILSSIPNTNLPPYNDTKTLPACC